MERLKERKTDITLIFGDGSYKQIIFEKLDIGRIRVYDEKDFINLTFIDAVIKLKDNGIAGIYFDLTKREILNVVNTNKLFESGYYQVVITSTMKHPFIHLIQPTIPIVKWKWLDHIEFGVDEQDNFIFKEKPKLLNCVDRLLGNKKLLMKIASSSSTLISILKKGLM